MCAIIGFSIALLSLAKSALICYYRVANKTDFRAIRITEGSMHIDCNFWYNKPMIYTVEGICILAALILIVGILAV